jgi:hypothetical protein
MSEAQDGVNKKKFSKHPAAIARRRGALERLEHTLAHLSDKHTEKQVKRMQKEVETLKSRI